MKEKILFVLPSLTLTNGVSKFLYNYLSNIDTSLLDISILTSNLRVSQMYIDFYKEKNISLFFTDPLSEIGFIKWYKQIKAFFNKNHDLDVVYSNVANQSYFIFKQAKKFGIKKYALHAHATAASDNKLKGLINNILISKVNKMLTYRFSCGDEAGKFVFKNKNFRVINNAIDYSLFNYNSDARKELKEKYKIEEKKVIGFVGRFVAQKNVFFFIELAKKLSNEYVIMMIGEGKQKKDFVEKTSIEGVDNKFIFVSETSEVNKYYSCFDYFLLPSLFEGLPVVGIEAQVNGLFCIFSDTISKEVKISSGAIFLKNDDINLWVENIGDYQRNSFIINQDYNIKNQALIFLNILLNL